MIVVSIFGGFLLDLALGDPPWLPHPVRLIGQLIASTEESLRRFFRRDGEERLAGMVLLCRVVLISYGITFLISYLAGRVSPYLEMAVNVLLVYTILATRSLDREVRKVYAALAAGSLPLARQMLSFLVGRETDHLNEEGIIRASVETVAENTVDGIIAPLFYLILGGPALGMAYKAVNTLDSMVGYKNAQYINLGWASARFDDVMNFIPARLTGFVLMPLAALLSGKDGMGAVKMVIRDRKNHHSPNSGHPEAAMAGALGIQLGGGNVYFGREVVKPTLGDAGKPLEPGDISDAIRIMYGTSLAGMLLFTLLWLLSQCVRA